MVKNEGSSATLWKIIGAMAGLMVTLGAVMTLVFIPMARQEARVISREEIGLELRRIYDRLDTLVTRQDMIGLEMRVQRIEEKLVELYLRFEKESRGGL